MKVLFAINSLGAGGAEHSLSEMLPLFQERGIESVVVCLEHRNEGAERSTRDAGFDVRFLRSQGSGGRVLELRQLLQTVGPDLLNTAIFDADVTSRLAAVKTRIPVLTSLVNTTYDPVRLEDPHIRRWRLRSVQAVDGWTARHLTAHFHAITNAVKEAAVRDLRLDPNRVTVVERGRDPSRLGEPSSMRRDRARRSLGLPASDPVVVTVGRQEFQKGQWLLLEAMPRIVSGHPTTTLLVAGRSGNASRRLQDVMHAVALNGRVRMLGHRVDVPEILAAADLFVFPSLYEGLGGALIEAMALGLPIVASDLPAIREVVEPGGNAILIPPGAPGEIAGAVDSLIRDPLRRSTMGARSREIFEQRFTLERSVTRMIELFERVARDRSSRR